MDAIARLLQAHMLAGRDPAAAEDLCREVAAEDPDNGFALHLLGVLRLRHGTPAQAREWLRLAVAARTDHLESRIALAEALLRCDDDAGAASELCAVLAADPSHAPALAALSTIRLRSGEAVMAHHLALRARAAAPDAVEPLVALGTALSALGRPAEARDALAAALALDPNHWRAILNLGNALLDLDQEDAAEWHLWRATALRPQAAEAWASLGFLLAGADRLDEAIAACDRAIALRPDFAQAYWNRSFARLRAGDFARGWVDYEWRAKHPRFGIGAHILPGREWDGGPLEGTRLLVNATQGLGDTIQLARYLPLLAARGGTVTLICDAALLRLLAQLPVALVRRGDRLPDYDAWIDQMSLPGRLGTTLTTIPAASGYLRACSPKPASAGLRVGLVCAGNTQHSNDFRRSMRPVELAPWRQLPGIEFVSLQTGPAAAELAALFGIADRSAELTDMAATAAIVAGLDVVVTVDTAVAHLAGALGRPVWILIPRAPDWRWLAGRDDTPWYSSAILFRQSRAGDWATVVRQVGDRLARLAASTLAPAGGSIATAEVA